jgi:hypothetical protein
MMCAIKTKGGLNSLVIFSFSKIIFQNTYKCSISLDSIRHSNFVGLILPLEFHSDYFLWSGDYGQTIKVNGEVCLSSSCIIGEDSSLKFHINDILKKKEIMEQILINNIARISTLTKSPYNEQINDLLAISKILNDHMISDVTDIPCKLCNDKIKLRFMRLYQNLCGYRGDIGCSIDLVVTSGKGNYSNYGPKSDCKYFRKFSIKLAEAASVSYPTTNRPVICKICSQVYWSYNMAEHYDINHPQDQCPVYFSIKEASNLKSFDI